MVSAGGAALVAAVLLLVVVVAVVVVVMMVVAARGNAGSGNTSPACIHTTRQIVLPHVEGQAVSTDGARSSSSSPWGKARCIHPALYPYAAPCAAACTGTRQPATADDAACPGLIMQPRPLQLGHINLIVTPRRPAWARHTSHTPHTCIGRFSGRGGAVPEPPQAV